MSEQPVINTRSDLVTAIDYIYRLQAEIDRLKIEVEELKSEIRKWEKFDPQDDDLMEARKQSEGKNKDFKETLCGNSIYIIALEQKVRKLQAEIARLKAERRWIPVSERLPEDNGTEISEAVLTCYETSGGSGAVTIRGLLNTGMWFDTSTGFLVNPANVTHWMPLPPAPESEG